MFVTQLVRRNISYNVRFFPWFICKVILIQILVEEWCTFLQLWVNMDSVKCLIGIVADPYVYSCPPIYV